MFTITSVVDWETTHHTCVTCQVESSAETFLQFQRDVEDLRRVCQPRKGRSLVKSGRWTFSFPAVDVPSIEVKKSRFN